MSTPIHHRINGSRVTGRCGRAAPVLDPACGADTGPHLREGHLREGLAILDTALDVTDSYVE